MKKALFVFNPLSGKGIMKNHLFDVIDPLVKAGYEVEVYPTQEPKDGYNKIYNCASGFDLVVVSGGDGTLGEAFRGLIQADLQIPLGYVPAGSTNDFANSIRIPKRIGGAAKVAVEGREVLVDAGEFNGRNFVYVAAFGVLTDVSYETKQEMKNALGHAAYFFEGVKRWHGLDEIHMKVEVDGVMLEDDFCYGMVGNSQYVAGVKINYASEVLLDDGQFEVVLINTPKNPIQLNRILSGMASLTYEDELIKIVRGSTIRFHSDDPIAWTLDGEFGGNHTDVEIRNIKQAVKVKVGKDYAPKFKLCGADGTAMVKEPKDL